MKKLFENSEEENICLFKQFSMLIKESRDDENREHEILNHFSDTMLKASILSIYIEIETYE